jgi:hypothetical protein
MGMRPELRHASRGTTVAGKDKNTVNVKMNGDQDHERANARGRLR